MVLAVPSPANGVAGVDVSAAFWNAQVRDSVGFLTNPPLCRMHQGTVQSVPNAADTPIQFDVNDADTYAGHSTVTNNTRYFAQVAGFYRFGGYASISATSTTVTTWAFFKKNSATRLTPSNFAPAPLGGNNRTWFVGTDRVFLAIGDYVEMFVNQNDGGARNTSVGANEFSTMFVEFAHG